MASSKSAIESQGKLITQWTSVGAWRRGPHDGRMERRATRFTLLSADFYGRGPHIYLQREPMFQTEDERSPRFMPGGSQDGNPGAIAAVLAEFGIGGAL